MTTPDHFRRPADGPPGRLVCRRLDRGPALRPGRPLQPRGQCDRHPRDIGYRIPPMTDVDVAELMESIRLALPLNGWVPQRSARAPSATSSAGADARGRLQRDRLRSNSTPLSLIRVACRSSAPGSPSPSGQAQGRRTPHSHLMACRSSRPSGRARAQAAAHWACRPDPVFRRCRFCRPPCAPPSSARATIRSSSPTSSGPRSPRMRCAHIWCTRRRPSTTTRSAGTSLCSVPGSLPHIIAHADDYTDDPSGPWGRRRRDDRVDPRMVRGVMLTHVVPDPATTVPAPRQRSDPHRRVVGATINRVDLLPATCGDPDCDADHGFEGTIASDDLVLRISADADGADKARRGDGLRPCASARVTD